MRAYWADVFHSGIKTPEQVDTLVAEAVRSGANTLIVQVRARANSCFLNTLEPVAAELGCSTSFDGLSDLIRKAKAAGLEVHAWMNAFTVWPASGAPPADPNHIFNLHGVGASGRANWLSVNSAGAPVIEGSYFIDPGHPDVAAHTARIYQHMVDTYAVDGIHFDYVRYTSNAAGYNPASVERFNLLKNRAGLPSPTDADWQQFRRDQVSAIVRRVYLQAIARRPEIKVSAALIAFGAGPRTDAAYLTTDTYRQVFQDWRGWMQEGILDLGVVMNYLREHNATHAGWFNDWIAFEKDRQGRRSLATGVGVYLNTISGSLAQVDRVLTPSAAGNTLAGFALYSYAATNCDPGSNPGCTNVPNSQFYDAMQQKFPAPAPIPAMPWKTAPTRGHVMGQVQVSGGSFAPVMERMVITLGSRTTTPDSTGFFGFVDVEPGDHSLSFSLAYGSASVEGRNIPVRVTAGVVTTVSNIAVTAQQFEIARPVLTAAGVTDAASFRSGPVAPGQLVTIFGEKLGTLPGAAVSLPLPTLLQNVQVLVNGQLAPLLYVSLGQINFQMPFGLTGSTVNIVVRNNGLESAAVQVPLAEAAPSLFPPVLHSRDYSLVTAASPARPGELLILYASGLGAVQSSVAAGAAAPAARTVAPVTVTAAGRAITPVYAGLAPGFAGLYQINVTLPSDLPVDDLAVSVAVAGRTSNVVSVIVR